MPQRILRHNRITLLRSAQPKRVQDMTGKSSYGLNRLRKAYDMVLQRWIINCLKMCEISDAVINVIEKKHENLENGIDRIRKKLCWGNEQKRYFSRRYAITVTTAMVPLDHLLRYARAGYERSISQEKIDHLMYMDVIKLFAKKWKRTGNSNTRS